MLFQANRYAPYLRDSIYLYLILLDEILEEEDDPRDGRVFFERSKRKTFQGLPCGVCYKWEYNKKNIEVTIFIYAIAIRQLLCHRSFMLRYIQYFGNMAIRNFYSIIINFNSNNVLKCMLVN